MPKMHLATIGSINRKINAMEATMAFLFNEDTLKINGNPKSATAANCTLLVLATVPC